MDVVRADLPRHRGDGFAPGLGRQVQRLLDPVRQALHVERVAQHGLGQLDGGAGELAEDEGAGPAVSLLHGHVLLADQVHPVDQRRDDHRVRERVVAGQLLLRQPPVQVLHRHVAARLREAAVDPPDVLLHVGTELTVLADVVPARHRDLEEREAGPQLRFSLEQHFHREQALDDPLGVVEAVDAEQHRPAAELLLKRGDALFHRGVPGGVGELRDVDGDGRGDRGHGPAVGQQHRRPAHLHPGIG